MLESYLLNLVRPIRTFSSEEKRASVEVRFGRGDTIVEVMLAFALFVLIAVGAVTLMNRGINMVDRSLEITLVREQIDAQASILRYAIESNAAAWQEIRDNLGSASAATSALTDCPTADELPDSAFISNISNSGEVVRTELKNASAVYSPSQTYSRFEFNGAPSVRGIWVVPVPVEGSAETFDMYIRSCWYTAGGSRKPEVLGTIVRLYDSSAATPSVVVTPPPALTCNNLDSYSNNLIRNHNFSLPAGNGPGIAPAAQFESDLPNRGPNVYPDDDGLNGTTPVYTGGFSLQNGNHWYGPPAFPNSLRSQVFPGDPARGVPASNTYFYSNPNQNMSQPPGYVSHFEGVLWSQTITVEENSTYDFTGYFDNILLPASTFGVDPLIQLRADGVPLMDPVPIPRNPDEYQRVSLLFRTLPGQTTVVLDIYDYARNIDGDDFGMTALALRKCI